MAEVNLDELRAQVTNISEKIVNLKKAAPVDKDAIAATVKELLDAKRTFSKNNNGIGVDGKPFEEPMSKAEKKAKAKAEKAAAAAAAGGVSAEGASKEDSDPNSASSKKKLAKKAEKAAKKAALKAQQKSSGGAETTQAPSNPKKQNPKNVPAKPSVKPSGAKKSNKKKSKLENNQLSYNPNAPLTERPVIALTVACLTNTINNFDIVSDHTRCSGPAMGLSNGVEVAGDTSIARYIARRSSRSNQHGILGGDNLEQTALVDSYVDYAQTLTKFQQIRRVKAVAATLNHALAEKTYVVGHVLTIADISLFSAIGFPSQASDAEQVQFILGNKSCPMIRWMNMMRSHPAVREATQLAMGISIENETSFDAHAKMDPLVEGMGPLEGATVGNVCTRFPPEPSGYLHIGHAKAVLMNEYYARRYKGRLIVRFDDTNPSKEKEEFQASIIEDLAMLGVKPDVITFTSDYFETIKEYAMDLITNGLAYMDDTPQEDMRKERMDRINSKHRDQPVEDCIKYFTLMCSGDEEGGKWCLRAKIDMTSNNGTLRDPVLYRQNVLPHHRSGTTHKAYPTYDLACPIVDSIEGVTHALRTTEYNDRDEQYAWIQAALGLRRVRVHAFARMNFISTVLSKRKLTWFVDNGHVTGWDDPRFPTVRGVIRRGLNLEALRSFICAQGASRNVVVMEWKKFWAENKKEIDKYAKRFMAIDKVENVELTVTDGPEETDNVYLSTDYLPKDPSFGKRLIRLSKKVLLEKGDVEGITVGEDIVLMRWGVIKITKVEGGLEGVVVPDGNFKTTKRKLSWIANVPNQLPVELYEFDNLISKEKLDEDDNFEDFINPNTIATTIVVGDFGLRNLQKGDIIQLERRGYFRVDQPHTSDDKGLVLFMIPDGKSKSMGGLTGKLAHR
mmetsp:Transcript_12588/g.14656  ORF Transcript_12588/g.14656 Transcript_12588/m.14656 type:complete len:902 (-) Transcript_12588:42-2747(-)